MWVFKNDMNVNFGKEIGGIRILIFLWPQITSLRGVEASQGRLALSTPSPCNQISKRIPIHLATGPVLFTGQE